MLDAPCAEPFEPVIAAAPCRLEWGPEVSAYLGGQLRAAACPLDERRTSRIAACQRAAVDVCQSLPAFPRQGLLGQAIVTDASMRGIRFLFDEQLYPGEHAAIWLPRFELGGEVARCRRLARKCYEVGVRLDAPLPAEQLKQFLEARRQLGT